MKSTKTAKKTSAKPGAKAKIETNPADLRQGADVAPAKGKSSQKPTRAKKAPTARPGATREGSKTAKVLELLKRPGEVTLQELMKATGWQAHSVRGFLSGAVGKKLGLTVASSKSEDGERRYSVKA